jgi:putrescine aminotransferase
VGEQQVRSDAELALTRARRHGPPGLALGQKLTGRGAIEVAAHGTEVVLSDGRRLLDFGSYAVTLLGHRHSGVCAAVVDQLGRLPTSTRVLANEPSSRLAAELVATVGGGRLPRVWFGLGGADAVEAALKLARLATGRPRVVALDGGFHGKTLGALAATHSPRYRHGLEPLLTGASHIPADVARLRQELARGDVAALIVEPIQGEGGVRPVPVPFLQAAQEAVRRAGALLVVDEIQTGLGRCGPLALSHQLGIEPDALLLGKPLGGGVMPLSAVLCSEELYEPLRHDPFVHTSTFSGHPLAAAAGSAGLEAVAGLLPRGEELARALGTRLAEIAARHPQVVVAVRGRGLLWGLECASREAAGWLLTELAPRGLLVSPCLGDPATIRLLPPLVTSDAQLARALTILHDACRLTATTMETA